MERTSRVFRFSSVGANQLLWQTKLRSVPSRFCAVSNAWPPLLSTPTEDPPTGSCDRSISIESADLIRTLPDMGHEKANQLIGDVQIIDRTYPRNLDVDA